MSKTSKINQQYFSADYMIMTYDQLSEKYGISTRTVSELVNKFSLKKRKGYEYPSEWTQDRRDQFTADYKDGMRFIDMAAKYNISLATAHQTVTRFAIPKRGRIIRQMPEKEPKPVKVKAPKPVKEKKVKPAPVKIKKEKKKPEPKYAPMTYKTITDRQLQPSLKIKPGTWVFPRVSDNRDDVERHYHRIAQSRLSLITAK